MMSVSKITPANSKEFLEANKESFVVLVFDGEFTGQQDVVEEAIKALRESEELKDKIVLGSVDVEQNNDLSTEFAVLSVPIVACIFKGQAIRKVDNLEPKKLITTIKEEMKRQDLLSTTTDTSGEDPKKKFQTYLKHLINRAPVMIFMKGEPSVPRCGFSKQLIQLLSKYDIKYETFDILQDEEVRQGLKELSDWPTYPQVYAKGEFVGGLDILKQLDETGELEATLKVQ